jgi:hypothetical protein
MTFGNPVLLSVNENKLTTTLLSRVAMKNDVTEEYKEELLQELIDSQPSLLPVSEFYEDATHLFSLGREIPVDTGGSEGFIDNMLVTDDGHLVVVETKLWRNSEAIREVVSQTLHYAMAVSQLSPLEFEACLSRADPRWRRLGKGETVAQYVQNFAASNSLPGLPDDFEDAFDRLRRAGEILLLIVGDGIRPSAERLVHWMNATAGSAPYKLGLIELCLYDLPGAARIAVPRTLLRTREASRHVVSVNLQGTARDQVAVTVTGPDKRHETRKIPLPGIPLTEERLTELIRSSNPPEIVEVAEQLRALLKSSGLATRFLPSEIQYGVRVDEDFIPLAHLSAQYIWFQIPTRAIRALGDDRFVECKGKINKVADFYRPLDVDDPRKGNALIPKYAVLKNKVEAFAGSVTEIAETVRNAMEAAS